MQDVRDVDVDSMFQTDGHSLSYLAPDLERLDQQSHSRPAVACDTGSHHLVFDECVAKVSLYRLLISSFS